MKGLRKKRWILLASILFILIILATSVMYVRYLLQEKKENIIKTITYKDDFRDFLYVEEGSVNPGNTAVVTTADTNFNLRYGRTFTEKWTCLVDAVYCRDTEKDIITDIEKAEYSIYDLVSGERIRTIDIKMLAEQKAPNQVMVCLLYTSRLFLSLTETVLCVSPPQNPVLRRIHMLLQNLCFTEIS